MALAWAAAALRAAGGGGGVRRARWAQVRREERREEEPGIALGGDVRGKVGEKGKGSARHVRRAGPVTSLRGGGRVLSSARGRVGWERGRVFCAALRHCPHCGDLTSRCRPGLGPTRVTSLQRVGRSEEKEGRVSSV